MKENNQLDLLQFGGIIVDDAIRNVFGVKDITNNKGKVVGKRVAFRKRSDVAEALDLKGKDNKEELDDAILTQSDKAWQKLRGLLAGLDDSWTLKTGALRKAANGEAQISLTVRQVKRAKVITAEQIAKAWGITIEEAQELIKANNKMGSPVDVDIEITPEAAATEAEQPELTQEEKDAAELARMEREEAEKAFLVRTMENASERQPEAVGA